MSKTLIAQIWDNPDVIGDYNARTDEVEQFWKPCLQSVKSWAKHNDFDYKTYSCAELSSCFDLSYLEDPALSNWERVCVSKIAILNNPKYDRICVMDADIHIWGNPQLCEGDFCIRVGGRVFPLNTLSFQQAGIYWTTIGPTIYQWICDQLKNPGERLQLLRNYRKFSRTPVAYGESGEQMLLCAYLNTHGFTNIDNHVTWGDTELKIDSFVHFTGKNKLKRFQKFRAAMVYSKIDNFWNQNEEMLKSKGLV